MSGESFFLIDHTRQQQPTHKGDVTQESKPQGDENRSGIMSYEDLKRLEKDARVKEELARVAKIYDGDPDDLVGEKKVKAISPEEAYRQNIEYAKGVTNLVLKMREYELAMYGSNDARQLEEAEGTNGVVKALETRAFVGGETDIDPRLWDRKIDKEEETEETGPDDQSRWGLAA